jgi:hypothetical protein
MEVFQNYSLIEIDRNTNKKDAKSNKLKLTAELDELS